MMRPVENGTRPPRVTRPALVALLAAALLAASAEGAEGGPIELACNVADARESDLRPAEGLAAGGPGLAAGLGTRPVWFYLVATACLLTCWEWFLYQRRWID